ncbi:hypothetical protein M9H77_02560 [Catharanthus roseus]|uniref:Uncharacterized protein n=1 Tax=Catharanthus roseus TaxID=4058 RepID=A0ACC0C951_CATRO|nr:hypothetical protein M9H77_02560 [Catharanthus roseus]
MVKVKNANAGRDGHGEEGGSSRGGKKGKGKQVARSETPSDKFISAKAAANYEDWTNKKRKIARGHRVDLSDMGGMEIIPALFQDIGWGFLLIVNELFYPMMLYEFYTNLQSGRIQTGGNVITSRVNGKNIAFDDRLLNSILETPEDGMCFYTKNKKCFIPICVVKRGHKSSITNMHSFVMLAMCSNILRSLSLDQVTISESVRYAIKNTFKRTGFSRNEDGILIRGGQEEDSENSEKEEEEEGNEPEDMDEDETSVEEIQRD